MPKVALIFGVNGQDGSYLASLLLRKGYTVFGTSRGTVSTSTSNLFELGILDQLVLLIVNPMNRSDVRQAFSSADPDEVYYLAGQSSVGRSFQEPHSTFESIAFSTLNILEVCRESKRQIRFYQAGSSECFGDTAGLPANEATPFSPRSPYAIAKVSAYWMVDTYRRSYNLFACTGILFNHESPFRPSQFVTQKIIDGARAISLGQAETLTLGRLDIERDWGWAPEYVDAMWRMLQQEQPEDFVIATGKTHRLVDFVRCTFEHFGLNWQDHVSCSEEFTRPSDIDTSNADPSHAARKLSWKSTLKLPEIVKKMINKEAL